MHFCGGIVETETIKCSFGDVETRGTMINDTHAVCASSFLQKSGLILLEVKFESRENIKTRFLSCKCGYYVSRRLIILTNNYANFIRVISLFIVVSTTLV